MQYREFGTENLRTVVMLHGGGLSWWSCREAAQLLAPDFHVVLPILDGHAGSDRPFTSIESNADEIISWIDTRPAGSVSMICGLSLGGQILLEILSRRSGICRAALVESAMVIPSPLVHALIGPSLACSYGLVRSRSFAKMQFSSLRIREDLFEEYYRDTCAVSRQDMTAVLKANTAYSLRDSVSTCRVGVHIFAGEKETRGILRSAEKTAEKIPGSILTVLPGLYHGEFSINHADQYADTVRKILSASGC